MDVPSRTILKILALTTLFGVALWLLVATHIVLTWLFTAFLLALAINPAVAWISKRAPWLRRGGAVALVFVGLLAVVALFAYTLVPPLVSESGQLVKQWPHYTNQFLNSSAGQFVQQHHLVGNVQSSQSQLLNLASQAGGSLVNIAQRIFDSFIAALTVTIFTIFMLLEGPYWTKVFFRFLPPSKRKSGHHLAEEMYRAVAAYMGSKLIMSLIAAVATFIVLVILHIPYALALSLIVALFDLVPLVGVIIGAVIVVVVALFTSFAAAAVLAIFFTVFQLIEDHLTQPLIMRHSVQLTSLTVIVAALLGAELAGILGALVAIPVAACAHILIREYYGEKLTT